MELITFKSLEEIFENIKEDKNTNNFIHNRFPVRFIFLPDFEKMKELYTKITPNKNCLTLDLEELLPKEDGWITSEEIIHKVKQKVKSEPTKDFVVFPLSEVSRFYKNDEFVSIFKNLCGIETIENKSQRMYIPLVGISQRFNTEFERYFSREWAPIWKLDEEVSEKLKITMCTDVNKCNINHKSKKEILFIDKVSEWLRIWKKSADEIFKKEVVCHSETLSFLYKYSRPDDFFRFVPVTNQKETLIALSGFNFLEQIPFNDEEEKYWNQLESVIKDDISGQPTSIDNFMGTLFNVKNVGADNVLDLWLQASEGVYKWLLKNYILVSSDFTGSYIAAVMENLSDYTDEILEIELWTGIFRLEKPDEKKIKQRLSFLKQIYSHKKIPANIERTLESELKNAFDKYTDIKTRMSFLTGFTKIERKKVFDLTNEAISESKISKEELLKFYKKVYPSLYNYLDNVEMDNIPQDMWIKEYFNEYRWSKVLNKRSEKFIKILDEKNSSSTEFYEWYYQLKPVASLCSISEKDQGLWIDAIGFEWSNLLYHILSKSFEINEIKIARSVLPTTTDCNRFDKEVYDHILDFDKHIHGQASFSYPDSLIDEISEIEKIIESKVSVENKMFIVSDHGLSAFVRKVHGINKKYNFNEAEHEGRCMWTDHDYSDDEDYIKVDAPEACDKKGKYVLMALKHDSLNDVARREVHGGATPEEIIVPVVVISNKTKHKESFSISTKYIELMEGESECTEITINPKPKVAILISEKGEEWKLEYNTNTSKWEVNFKNLETGEHKMTLNLNGEDVHSKINIIVKGGIEKADIGI